VKILELTDLEAKAAWLCADAGVEALSVMLARDPQLYAAALSALTVIWRAHNGMPPKEAA
jgi:hypothetical protein